MQRRGSRACPQVIPHTGKRPCLKSSNQVSLFLQNHINPAMDFTQTPPGMLALDNMLYLAKFHQDTYIRVKAGSQLSQSQCHLFCLPPSSSLSSSPHRLSWRTAAEKTNMNAPLAAVPLSSPKCSVKSYRLGNYVSPCSSLSSFSHSL